MQKRRNSSALAMELILFCIKPSIYSSNSTSVGKKIVVGPIQLQKKYKTRIIQPLMVTV